MRLAPLLLALPLLLTACSSEDPTTPEPTALATSGDDDCDQFVNATEIPERCVPNQVTAKPEVPKGRYPATSAEIAAVTLEAEAGDLARGGNDADPTLTTQTFRVTVPKGGRLEVTAACNGATFLEVATVPDSLAELTMSCFEEGSTSELSVSDDVFQPAPKSFDVTVTTQAPSRWFATVGSTSEALPPAAG
ncbi:MAG: hypothetical protein Q8R60_13485 [Mycobacteriales bacterium]|nr:hypothetical protein [Mycobacteriales bacterium]